MEYYVIDAFTDRLFSGNPAGVCLAEERLPDAVMQDIAAENNLSETAFVVKEDGRYDLRWFTPRVEIDLCGHATLASAYVLMNYVDSSMRRVDFNTKSGPLTVRRDGELYAMDFPARKPAPCAVPKLLEKALGAKALETQISSRDLLVLLESESAVAGLCPDFALLKQIEQPFIIVTAKGGDCDFVSRFFAPNAGIDEDPVTGSSHCVLIPFWSERLGKNGMTARQLSKRGGVLYCKNLACRVEIAGNAVLYLKGSIGLPPCSLSRKF